jgi:hypothetical protein
MKMILVSVNFGKSVFDTNFRSGGIIGYEKYEDVPGFNTASSDAWIFEGCYTRFGVA